MRTGIMQPYFLPYIGYFQLIYAVDKFVIYDNIEYTKKGWINRNRILLNNRDEYFTIPIKKDSDFLHVRERELADNADIEKKRILRKIRETYRKAPFFKYAYDLLENIFLFPERNLFEYIFNSINIIARELDLRAEIIISSKLPINHNLKAQDKVIEICKFLNASTYINPSGGVSLYSNESFLKEGLTLKFLDPQLVPYKQYDNDFIPWLSIIDVMMFNDINFIKNHMLNKFALIHYNH